MERINSRDDLKKLREGYKSSVETVVAVGMATCGIAAGARDVTEALKDEIKNRGLNIEVVPTGCYGFCFAEPLVEIRAPGKPVVRYGHVDGQVAREIVEKHLVRGESLSQYIITQEVTRP